MKSDYVCSECSEQLCSSGAYEYRGVYSCEGCFDKVVGDRDYEREQLIAYEDSRHNFKDGLNIIPDNPIGRHNYKMFKNHLEALSKESLRMLEYNRFDS